MEEKLKKLINKWLITHFPIVKAKDRKSFKRAVKITVSYDGITVPQYLFINKSKDTIKKYLTSKVSLVLGISEIDIKPIINNYII